MVPEFLVIGGVIADRTPSGLRVGGAAAYSALTAAKLGLRVALVTNPHTKIDVAEAFPGITVCLVGKPVSTTFRNELTSAGRVQFWEGRGVRIRPQDIPLVWRQATLVHIATVAQDVHPSVVGQFHGALVGVTPQGWFRRRDATDRVYPGPWRGARQVLERADVVVVSPEDYGQRRLGVERYLARTQVLVITQASKGARLRSGGRWRHIPAVPAKEVDATGAGDVFAAAFLVRYAETRNADTAARFAACAASLSVEGEGTSALPTRAQVLALLSEMGTATAL